MIKRTLQALAVAVALLFCLGYWLMSLLEPPHLRESWKETQSKDLAYLQNPIKSERGRALIVVTSVNRLGTTGRYTGYELTELARAYYVFQTNGFRVDIASPQGGEPSMVIDDDDMGPYDFAFLNDAQAQEKLRRTLSVNQVNPQNYDAILFIGGKGAMFDFPNNMHIARLVFEFNQSNKIIAAVCHGSAAFIGVVDQDGSEFVKGKAVTGFTNDEELFLMSNATEVFPFLLQEKLNQIGANFYAGPMYLNTVIQDGNLLTGQNPWSVWALAERVVTQLGYQPLPRQRTREENTIDVLAQYHSYGNLATRETLEKKLADKTYLMDRNLLAMHGLVALIQGKVGKAIDMVNLVRLIKEAKE